MAYGGLIGSSTAVLTSHSPPQKCQSPPLGAHAYHKETCTTSEGQAPAGCSPPASSAEIAALGEAGQRPQDCGASACETQAGESEGLAEAGLEETEAALEDARLIESIAQWTQLPLTSASEQNDQTVVGVACAAWWQAQSYSQAAAVAAASLVVQCLRHWFAAGGDTGEISLVTTRMLIIMKDIIIQQAAPTPAEAAERGRKPLPNRKRRK